MLGTPKSFSNCSIFSRLTDSILDRLRSCTIILKYISITILHSPISCTMATQKSELRQVPYHLTFDSREEKLLIMSDYGVKHTEK